MEQETVTIPKEEYAKLKKKAEIADDILLQLESMAILLKTKKGTEN